VTYKKVFILAFRAFRLALGPSQPPIQWVLEIKQLRHEADHSHQSSGEVENAWGYTSTLPYVFMVWCLIKHTDIFTLFSQQELQVH
jgi:hypothetical protein